MPGNRHPDTEGTSVARYRHRNRRAAERDPQLQGPSPLLLAGLPSPPDIRVCSLIHGCAVSRGTSQPATFREQLPAQPAPSLHTHPGLVHVSGLLLVTGELCFIARTHRGFCDHSCGEGRLGSFRFSPPMDGAATVTPVRTAAGSLCGRVSARLLSSSPV